MKRPSKDDAMLPQITVDIMFAHKPCGWDHKGYTRGRITELWDGRAYIDALDLFKLDIPSADIIWAVTRDGVIPNHVRTEAMCRCLESIPKPIWEAWAKEHKSERVAVVQDVVDAIRGFQRGTVTREELQSAAEYAAGSAAGFAARSAAESAEYAARSAAGSAAESAAGSAAGFAARSAAWSAAESAEYAAESAESDLAWDRQIAIYEETIHEYQNEGSRHE